MAKTSAKKNPSSQPSTNGEANSRLWILRLLLIVATAIAYLPAWNGKQIWDDKAHITAPALRSLQGLKEIWLEPGATQQYYPVVHSAFWLEHKLWGDNVLPYHLVNILLHGFSAILLFQILRRLNVPGAWLAAALFALHPVQVETVAWISELKNTLSGAFCLSSALLYLQFDEKRRPGLYGWSLVLYLLGLMSKTAMAGLPGALLVVLWWQRGALSWKRDIRPLLPFFAVGLTCGLFTAWVERNFIGAQGAAFHFSLIERGLIAGRDFWFYLFKIVWPAELIFIYPRWNVSSAIWWQYLFPAALLLLLALLWRWRGRARGPLAACLIFLGMLFPALGFINVYPFIFSFVADHFQYLACIGPLTLAAAGISIGLDSFAPAQSIQRRAIYAALLLALGLLTWRQCFQYSDIETLWRTTIARNPDAWMAHSNLGYALLDDGEADEAVAQFQKVIELQPTQPGGYNNLGRALVQKGRVAEGTSNFQKALEISPNDADAHNNLGGVLLQGGDVDSAVGHFERALFERPDLAQTEINLGNAFLLKGDIEKAIEHYRRTLKLPCDHAESHCNIGKALRRGGRIDEAIAEYREALTVRPDYADAHNNLANALRQKGDLAEAAAHYEEALQDEPRSVLIANNLAWLLATAPDASVRNGARAVEIAEKASRLIGGDDPVILHTLAAAYAENGRFADAVSIAQRALAVAEARGPAGLSDSLRSKIELYQARTPYHESAR